MIFNKLNKLNEYIQDKKIEYGIDTPELLLYGFISILVFSFISKYNITIATIVGIMFAYYILVILANSNKNNNDKKKNMLENKKKYIRPRDEIIEKYDDIVEFLFSIQNLYIYNPPVYQELVETIKNFLTIYEETINIPKTAHKNHTNAEIKLYHAVNLLQSIIINTDINLINNENIDSSINASSRVLYNILKKYLDEIELIVKKDIKYNGYNINTLVLNPNKIKPYNFSNFSTHEFDIL
jgi:hypothetical protein